MKEDAGEQKRKVRFLEKQIVWKNYMEEIINKDNDWNHMTEADMVII